MARPVLSFKNSGDLLVTDDGYFEIDADDRDDDGLSIYSRSGWSACNNTHPLQEGRYDDESDANLLTDDIKHPKRVLGVLGVQGSHVTLQSRCDGCIVVPPELDTNLITEAPGKLSLQPSTPRCQYNVVLRPNDRVYFWLDKISCTCSFKLLFEDVQVESSHPYEQGLAAPNAQRSQAAYAQPKNVPGSPEEASDIQKKSTERPSYGQVLAATPVAGSTGASQIVKDTPATDRRLDTSQTARFAPRAQLGLGAHMEESNRWRGNGSALSHSASMTADPPTVDPRNLSVQDPEEDEEDATPSENSDEEDDEEDIDAVKSPKTASEPPHHSASNDQAEKTSGLRDSHDNGNVQRNKKESPAGHSSSPRVVVPPPGSKRKAPGEESTRPAKRTGRVKESEDVWTSPSKSTAGYGRRARAKLGTHNKVPADDLKTPRSSNGSRRSSIDEGDEASKDSPIRVVFSNTTVVDRHSPMKFLEKRGVRVLDSVSSNGYDFLWSFSRSKYQDHLLTTPSVNSKGPMSKSFKFLMSVISGKTLITDKWVTESHKAQKLLDTHEFIATNAPEEWGWGSSQEEVAEALDLDRSNLFKGIEVVITPHLKKEWASGYKDIEKLLKATGASKVSSKLARAQSLNSDTIVIGSGDGDLDAIPFADNGFLCFSKDFVSISILRGQFDLDSDEFKIKLQPQKKTGKVGRPKKSK